MPYRAFAMTSDASANQEWTGLAYDASPLDRAICAPSVVDAYMRECVALEVFNRFANRRMKSVLDELIAERGEPRSIRCDNGPELTSLDLLAWSIERRGGGSGEDVAVCEVEVIA